MLGNIDGMKTRLRPVRADDEAMLFGWLQQPDVYAHWGGHAHSTDEIREQFIDPAKGVSRYIVETKRGEALGYIQSWNDEPGDGGIDMFLLPEARGRGVGTDSARALVKHLLTKEMWARVTVDPLLQKADAIRFWRKLGFRDAGEIDREEGRCLLMVIEG